MKVVNFEQDVFDHFLEKTLKNWKSDSSKILILGIKEGGLPLAENVFQLLNKSGNKVDLKFIKCQRPSTSLKKKSDFRKSLIRSIFKITPFFVLDYLRNVEHDQLTKKAIDYDREIILDETIDFNSYDKILIVDDAVDSGVTLKKVTEYVQDLIENKSVVKSLAVVVTNEKSVLKPDFFLYENVLIRFPWSLDG
ncbi:MAG: hypothetical protein KIG88_06475 [Weeksellaceae bacterium]|nr:hypothetical protein [Weeksellaceae bacterium]